eukprot:CAMPEP_0181508582 /NCGR_PEP_ID=MMETSP1110-20121109/59827_1 /TAXON_ID=174948 /ORGANISM="Symbiodinium sp., Strain CCMP421" /LENGTH=77 /DNA_ID=CAMNT_0023637961 /DNA_START=111 /DNA_END=342 /DNA_ORIENTATION=+
MSRWSSAPSPAENTGSGLGQVGAGLETWARFWLTVQAAQAVPESTAALIFFQAQTAEFSLLHVGRSEGAPSVCAVGC